MFGSTERQRLLICWSVSILLHTGLLIWGVALLVKRASFQVEAGKTFTQMELTIESIPETLVAPPASTSPPVPPLPPMRAAPVPEPVKPQIRTTLESIFTPHLPSVVTPTKPQPPKPLALSKSAPTQETSSPSTGAIEAQPDDLHNEPPEYPEESRIAREQGVVVLQVEVTAAGEPARVGILKSSGYFRLDQAARHAVQYWKFHPAMTAGIPMSSEAEVPVHFKLQ